MKYTVTYNDKSEGTNLVFMAYGNSVEDARKYFESFMYKRSFEITSIVLYK